MNDFPGLISANEVATGLLIRGIKINGEYAIVTNCTVFPVQEVDEIYLIQGGPRSAIANIGTKHIEGEITMPLRVNKDGSLETAARILLENAQNPDTSLTIETNHILSYLGVTAFSGGTDNNDLVNLDCCVVKKLTLSASESDGINIKADIIGMIDSRAESDLISPPDNFLLHRQLTFADCDASRMESDMRTISSIEISIDNEIELLYFLMQIGETPYDQPNSFGVKSCKWTGFFEEVMRKGVEQETHIHGGFMVEENLTLQFGPVKALYKVPMFKIGEQPLASGYLKRKTDFFGQISPEMRNEAGDLFIFS